MGSRLIGKRLVIDRTNLYLSNSSVNPFEWILFGYLFGSLTCLYKHSDSGQILCLNSQIMPRLNCGKSLFLSRVIAF